MCCVQSAKCITHLLVIRPSSSPETAFHGFCFTRGLDNCTRSHKQSFFSPSRPMQPHISDQSHSKQSRQTDSRPMNTQDVRDSFWYGDVCFFNSLWKKTVTVTANTQVKTGLQIMAFCANAWSSMSEEQSGLLPRLQKRIYPLQY